MERVYNFRRTVAPLCVVAVHLLVGERGESVDRVRAPPRVEVLELARGQPPIGVVGDAGEVVRLYVCSAPDVKGPNLDVVGVDQQEELP